MKTVKLIKPGTRFGYLTVNGFTGEVNNDHRKLYSCTCDYGNSCVTSDAILRDGHKRSCNMPGCKYRRILHGHSLIKDDLTGMTQGWLTVLRKSEHLEDGSTGWVCTCKCNPSVEHIFTRAQLVENHKSSCGMPGCGYFKLRSVETRQKFNGHVERRLAAIFHGMETRCRKDSKDPKFHTYRENGIEICEEWRKDIRSFVKWALDTGYKPDSGLSIDRIDNLGPYAPWNCRWVTSDVQANNKSDNVVVEANFKSMTLSEWARYLGIEPGYLHSMKRKKGIEAVKSFIWSHDICYDNVVPGITEADFGLDKPRKAKTMDIYEQPVVCITHTDSDGHLAGYLVKKKYGKNAKIIYSNYGREVPNFAFQTGGRMFVTDFSLTEFEFEKAKRMGMDVVWIDHHKSNIDKLSNSCLALPGIRDTSHSGSYWTFHFLYPMLEKPRAVRLIDSYDLWKFDEPGALEFQMGLKMFETKVTYHNCFIWDKLLSDDKAEAERTVDLVINLGRKILNYMSTRHKTICDELTYVAEHNGQKILAANTKQANSKFFDSADRTTVDAMSMVQFAPDICKYRCSLYSPDDRKPVVQIASMFGGGGHDCACGFQSVGYPWKFPTMSVPIPMVEIISRYKKLDDMRKDVAVNQSCCKSDRIALTSLTFKSKLFGMDCMAINHPYISELIRILPSQVDLINPLTGSFYEMFVGFVLVKTGQYRVGVYYNDQTNAPSAKDFELMVAPMSRAKMYDFYEEPVGQFGKVIWFYFENGTECPVELPVSLT